LIPFQDLSQQLRECLKGRGDASGNLIAAFETDLNVKGLYKEEWLVITTERLRVFTSNGHSAEREELTQRLDLPLAKIKSTHTESLVGGSALIAVVDDEPVEVVRYTHRKDQAFARVNKYLNNVAKYNETDQAVTRAEPPVLPADTEAETHCPRCKLLLPEGTRVCPACMSKARVLARLATYLRPFVKETVLLSSMILATTGLGLISPYLTKPLMDVVLVPRSQSVALETRFFWLGIIVLCMLLSQILSSSINIAQGRVAARLAHKLTHSLRVELYQHLQLLSIRFFEKRRVGALMTRVTQDTEELESVLSNGAQFFVANLLTLIGIVIVLSFLSWRLFLELIIPIPLVIVLSRLFWKKLQLLWPRWWHYRSRLNAAINENFSGIRIVKAFAQEEREIDRFKPTSNQVSDAAIRAEQTWATLFPAMTFLTGLGALLVWYLGGRQVLSGALTLGTLFTFIAYLSMFYGPLQFVNRFSSWLGRALAAAERVFEILDTAPEVAEPVDPVSMSGFEGRVEFKNVTFGYDADKPVLQDLNLTVKAGEMIGIVGHSGAGKSTMISLICRLYDVNEGQLLVDGVDIRKINQKDLRQNFGVVMQDCFLFNCPIAENIAYSKPAASSLEIMLAAAAANAHDFISSKPDGYDTMAGERGTSLSMGERQRISIARAILHDPRFLILDEATSSVDTDTEKQIQEAIARLAKGRTTFVVAHRLSTLRDTDRIAVIKGAKILELGTREELLAKKGEFHRLLQMQQTMAGNKSAPEAEVSKGDTNTLRESLTEGPLLRLFQPGEIKLTSQGVKLTLAIKDEVPIHNVNIKRLFPLTQPDRYCSVRDDNGKEIGVISRISDLDTDSQRVISEALDRTYLMPVVMRIEVVKERFGTVEWAVETTRGPRKFTMRNLRENIVQPSPGRYVLSDVDGTRYDVPDLEKLDAKSRAHLWHYV